MSEAFDWQELSCIAAKSLKGWFMFTRGGHSMEYWLIVRGEITLCYNDWYNVPIKAGILIDLYDSCKIYCNMYKRSIPVI